MPKTRQTWRAASPDERRANAEQQRANLQKAATGSWVLAKDGGQALVPRSAPLAFVAAVDYIIDTLTAADDKALTKAHYGPWLGKSGLAAAYNTAGPTTRDAIDWMRRSDNERLSLAAVLERWLERNTVGSGISADEIHAAADDIMPTPSKAHAEHRRRIREAPVEARLDHTDMHTPHLAIIGAAQTDDDHAQAKAMLAKATTPLVGALDFLLEVYGDEVPADLRAAIQKYLDETEDSIPKARKWLSGEGYGLVHHVCREHLVSYGGSMKGWRKFIHGVGSIFTTPIKWISSAIKGGSKLAGQVTQNLAPVTDAVGKLAPAIAAAAQSAGPAALAL